MDERRKTRSAGGQTKFFRIELEFGPIRISGRIVGIGLVPRPAGEDRCRSVDVRDGGSGQGCGIVMDDVKTRRVRRQGRFRRYRGIHGTDVRLVRSVFGILRITGQRNEAYEREDCQNRDDDQEFPQGKSGKARSRWHLSNLGRGGFGRGRFAGFTEHACDVLLTMDA